MRGANELLTFLCVTLLLVGCASAPPKQAARTSAYHLTKSIALGAPDRWDSVVFDPVSTHVYVAHGNRVTVVDVSSGAVVGNVEGFSGGTHGIAIANSTGRGYTDDGKAGIAASFDLVTLKVGKRIKAEDDADGINFDPYTGHIYVVDGDSGKITVIDPKKDRRIATIDVGAGLEFAVTDKAGKLYVNGAEKREIIRIDTATNKVDARWPIPGCERPHGIALDVDTHRLFSSCVNAVLVVLDTTSGQTVATLPIGAGTDGAAFDPKRHLILSSNGKDGTLSVIEEQDPHTFRSLGEIKTAMSARTMDIDPVTGRVFLAAADLDPKAVGPNGRPLPVPGTLKLLIFEPTL